jgi:hypothetical protein
MTQHKELGVLRTYSENRQAALVELMNLNNSTDRAIAENPIEWEKWKATTAEKLATSLSDFYNQRQATNTIAAIDQRVNTIGSEGNAAIAVLAKSGAIMADDEEKKKAELYASAEIDRMIKAAKASQAEAEKATEKAVAKKAEEKSKGAAEETSKPHQQLADAGVKPAQSNGSLQPKAPPVNLAQQSTSTQIA